SKNLIVVAVIGSALLADAIALRGGTRGELAEWALVLAGLRRPVEAVLLARLADNALCVNAIAGDAPVGIFLLRVDIGETGLDRAQLIAADAAIKDLLPSGRGIEPPGAILAHERDREWPIFPAEHQRGLVRTLHHHLMLVIVSLDNATARRRIGDRIAGGDHVAPTPTHHPPHPLPPPPPRH